MSVKIKLTTDLGGHKAGDTIDVSPKTAEYLVELEHAESVKGRASKKTDDAIE